MACGNDFVDRGHAHQIRAEDAQHAHLGWSFVGGTAHAGVDAFAQRLATNRLRRLGCQDAQGRCVGVGHVHKAGTQSFVIGPSQGRKTGQIQMVADAHDLTHGQRRLDAARHVGHHCDPHSQRRGYPHAEADLRWRIALVCVHATAQHQRSLARHGSIEESARMARHRGLGKARKLGVVE